MPIELPLTPSKPFDSFSTVIGPNTYIFNVRWNSRDAGWYIDILEQDETPIRLGLKVVLGTYIGRTCTHSLFQNGAFIAIDSSGTNTDPGLDDLGFGARVGLTYWTAHDLYMAAFGLRVAPR